MSTYNFGSDFTFVTGQRLCLHYIVTAGYLRYRRLTLFYLLITATGLSPFIWMLRVSLQNQRSVKQSDLYFDTAFEKRTWLYHIKIQTSFRSLYQFLINYNTFVLDIAHWFWPIDTLYSFDSDLWHVSDIFSTHLHRLNTINLNFWAQVGFKGSRFEAFGSQGNKIHAFSVMCV
jgi:hypothetical protein